SPASVLRYRAEHPDLHALGDLHMAEDGQRREQPFYDHAHIGPGLGRSHQNEALAGIQMAANDLGRFLAKLLELARIDVEFANLPLRITLQRLMEGEIPTIAEPEHLEHACIAQVAANLLRHADANM